MRVDQTSGQRYRRRPDKPRLAALGAGPWLWLALILMVSGVIMPSPVVADPAMAMKPVPPADLSTLLDDGDVESFRDAVAQSLAWLERQPAGRRLVFGPRIVTASQQSQALKRLLALLADDPAPDVLEERMLAEFDVSKAAGRADGSVLFTGYHEPVVEAAERPSPEYAVPIFGVPDDLVEASLDSVAPWATRWAGRTRITGRVEGRRIVPYWSRAEIEDGRLTGRGRILAWARDPVDVFFMEVEGSGTLRLPDGREIRVGHAATNGRPYRSIGQLLVEEGKLERDALSMQTIRAWLAANPRERNRVLRHNESYVFFRRREGSPLGSLGVPLTPQRSIATDYRIFPPGALAFIRTERPMFSAGGGVEWRPVSRFVLNQDTGGAIRGPGRVDVFWGRGRDADLAAGVMKDVGELYFLVPKVSIGSRAR